MTRCRYLFPEMPHREDASSSSVGTPSQIHTWRFLGRGPSAPWTSPNSHTNLPTGILGLQLGGWSHRFPHCWAANAWLLLRLLLHGTTGIQQNLFSSITRCKTQLRAMPRDGSRDEATRRPHGRRQTKIIRQPQPSQPRFCPSSPLFSNQRCN